MMAKERAVARKRIRMERIRDIIRYAVTTDLSERAIGRALRVSRTVVSKYTASFYASGLSRQQIGEMSDSDLLAALENAVRVSEAAGKEDSRYGQLSEKFPHFVRSETPWRANAAHPTPLAPGPPRTRS